MMGLLAAQLTVPTSQLQLQLAAVSSYSGDMLKYFTGYFKIEKTIAVYIVDHNRD